MQSAPGGSGDDERAETQRAYGRTAGLGLTFAATIAAFTGLGWWVDTKFGTTPVFLLVGLFLGFAGALVSLVSKFPAAGRPRDRTPPPE